MKRIHLAISTDRIEESVKDYSQRLGIEPCVVVAGEDALWRTNIVNLSIRHDAICAAGSLRHLGWEESQAETFSEEVDVNGIVWERFSAEQQAEEINIHWPGTGYIPENHDN